MPWRGSPLLLALQTPTPHACPGWLSQTLPLPLVGQGCTGRADSGPASLWPTSEMCRMGPCPPPTCKPPPTLQQGVVCTRGACSPAGLRCAECSAHLHGQDLATLLGSNSNLTQPPGLTFRPIHLFTGFMRKEERKPLMYITRGMVAMYFCKRQGLGDELWVISMGPLPMQPRHVGRDLPCAHLGQQQRVGEVHGDVGLGQVDDEPGGHVEHRNL